MWKSIGITAGVLAATTIAFIGWFYSLIDRSGAVAELAATTPADVAYIQRQLPRSRGKILAVVSSTTTLGETDKPTGYEHTELARAYYVFTVNGFEVDIASPAGGEPRAVIDDEDMGALDYAFLNDPAAMAKATNTLRLADVSSEDYTAIYFVGGKGTMWDFPDDPDILRLANAHVARGKLIGAVCHGPAALLNVRLPDGKPFLAGRRVTAFSNAEELFLIPDAAEVFPFLLEDALRHRGAQFQPGLPYLENIAVSDGLVTGQNPWSVYATAEQMIQELGYAPVQRTITGDENAVDVLLRYHQSGGAAARELVDSMHGSQQSLNRNLLIIHGLVAGMQWRLKTALELLVLAQHAKSVAA